MWTAFYPALKVKVSAEFYEICRQVIEEGTTNVTENDVISSKKLSEREKISVLLLPVIQNTTYTQQTLSTRAKRTPLQQYQSARASCAGWYALECTAALFTGPIGAAIGVALATPHVILITV